MDHGALVLIEIGALILGIGLLSRLAAWMGISPIPLILLGGLAFGEGGLIPFSAGEEFIEIGAEIGVILLLLMLGLEYTAQELVGNLKGSRTAGLIDMALNAAPGVLIALLLGWGPVAGDGAGLVHRLTALIADGYRVVVAADGEGSADRLAALLRDHGLDLGGNEPGEVVDHCGVGVLAGHECSALGGAGRDSDKLAFDRGGDQRGVEVASPEAVAHEPDPYRGEYAPNAGGVHPPPVPAHTDREPPPAAVGEGPPVSRVDRRTSDPSGRGFEPHPPHAFPLVAALSWASGRA